MSVVRHVLSKLEEAPSFLTSRFLLSRNFTGDDDVGNPVSVLGMAAAAGRSFGQLAFLLPKHNHSLLFAGISSRAQVIFGAGILARSEYNLAELSR